MSVIDLSSCRRRRSGARRRPSVWQLLDAAMSDLPELCGCDAQRAITCAACGLDTSGALVGH